MSAQVDSEAAALYQQRVAERGPPWEQLGDITKSVWRERVLDGQSADQPTLESETMDLLTTGDIAKMLGFQLPAAFITEVLKVPLTQKVQAASCWTPDQFRRLIVPNFIDHLEAVAAGRDVDKRSAPKPKPRRAKKVEAAAPAGDDSADDLFGDDDTDDLFADDSAQEDDLFS